MNTILPAWSKFIIYPFLESFLGYITNWIAIKLLFRPKKKIFGIQGLLQKRKSLLAQKAGEAIREYLLNTQEIKKVVDKEKVKKSINKLVDKTLLFVPRLGKKALSKILREMTYLYFFDKKSGYIKDEMLELALSDSDLENIIREKIMNYDIGEIEDIINKVSHTEIRFILYSGAVLGLIVGIIEVFLPF
jgi:uncharacterized membrane protein YheB (UPF0754 family)